MPLILLKIGLMITAVIHVLKHPKYRFGNQVFWLIVVVFFQFFGPVLYFVFGKGDEE
ncbi:MAG: PLD nuclease N-terminal domain-containing protein [Enterococcus aquimarinus]